MLFHFGVADRLRDLPLMGLKEVCQHKHRTVEQPGKNPHNGQKADERRHGTLRRGFVPNGLPFFAAVVKDALKA
jgi:hypothetical protein